jgi:hypothetical protein
VWNEVHEKSGMFMLKQLRKAHGEFAPLSEKPGQQFDRSERVAFQSFFILPMLFRWDADLASRDRIPVLTPVVHSGGNGCKHEHALKSVPENEHADIEGCSKGARGRRQWVRIPGRRDALPDHHPSDDEPTYKQDAPQGAASRFLDISCSTATINSCELFHSHRKHTRN